MAKNKTRKATKKSKSKSGLKKIDSELSQVLSVEKSILKEERNVQKKELRIQNEEQKVENGEKTLEKIEHKVENNEKKEQDELAKLEKLEQEIKSEVGSHPLARITFKDIVKGLVGAFIGLCVHYTFTYGVEIAARIDTARVTLLYIISFFIGLLFIYATGFRKVKDPALLMFMPIRLIVLYIAAIIMSIVVLFIFYPEFGHDLLTSYKMVGGVLLAAVIGACTADLIGKD